MTEAEFRRVLYGFKRAQELPDGYALAYSMTDEWSIRLGEFRDVAKKRLPAFRFELARDEDRGLLWLQMTGPAGTKDYLTTLLEHARRRRPLSFAVGAIKLGVHSLTGPFRVLPDYLIIGAERCGTTSLHNYLSKHPFVVPPARKDIHFFNLNYGRGANWYRTHFPTRSYKQYSTRIRGKGFATGDVTPSYLFHPHAPRRVREILPRVKLLVLFRNPVERAFSHYQMALRDGYETLPFEEAIEKEEERLRGELEKMLEDDRYYSAPRHLYSYLSRGLYVDQLTTWMNFFPREQILVLKSEELYRDPAGVLRRTQEFLGLPWREPGEYRKYNHAPYPGLESAVRKRLIDYFEPHNERLYELLGETDPGWRKDTWS